MGSVYTDRPGPLTRFQEVRAQLQPFEPAAPDAAQFFGGAGQADIDEYGTDPAVFAEISVKSRKHAAMLPTDLWRGGSNRVHRRVRCQIRPVF